MCSKDKCIINSPVVECALAESVTLQLKNLISAFFLISVLCVALVGTASSVRMPCFLFSNFCNLVKFLSNYAFSFLYFIHQLKLFIFAPNYIRLYLWRDVARTGISVDTFIRRTRSTSTMVVTDTSRTAACCRFSRVTTVCTKNTTQLWDCRRLSLPKTTAA